MRFAVRIPPRVFVPSRRSPRNGTLIEALEGRQLLALVNPSFEQGMVGWSFDRGSSGQYRVTPQNFEANLRAQQGFYFAELTSGSSAADVGRYTTVANTFEAQVGDTISGFAFFKNRAFGTNTGNADGYVAIKTGFGDPVATLFDEGAETVGPNGGTGWTYFEYTFTEAGVYKIEGGVANLAPGGLSSYLGLDNVVFSGTDAAHGTTTPVVDAGGPYETTEGGSLTVTARAYDVDDDPTTFRWDFNRDGRADATGRTVTIPPFQLQGLGLGDGPGTFTISVEADDGRGHRSSDTAALTVHNAPPVIDPRSFALPATSPEGRPLGAFLRATDPAGRLDPVRVEWLVTKDGEVVRPRGLGDGTDGAQFSYVPQDDGEYAVTAFAIDDEGSESSLTRTTTVTNVAPAITSLAGPDTGVSGQERRFSASFVDPGAADTHTTAWSVRDESGAEVAAGAGTEFAFTPTGTGTYVVTFGVGDDDGGTASATRSVAVRVAELQADPEDESRTVLAVGGTLAADRIDLFPGAEAGSVQVVINDVVAGTFSGAGRVVAFGQAGNDILRVHDLGLPVTFFGGDGDDKLITGSFSDVLVGGDGDDKVLGRGPAAKVA